MAQLLLVTGKGGVGKSTCSAAVALHYATEGLKTILISSDPAHSTDDTVGVKITDTPKEIFPNLWAMNINATKAIQERTDKIKAAFAQMFSNIIPNLDPEAMGMSALPGIDEWGACEVMGRLLRDSEYDLIIFDTAPTGHTLKALTAPDSIKEMLLKVRRMKRKISGKLLKGIVFKKGTDELEELLAESCDEIDLLNGYLRDPAMVSIVLVSIPTEAGFMEFYRTIGFLRSIQLDPKFLIINNIIPDMGEEVWKDRSSNAAVAMVYHEHQNQKPWITRYQQVCAAEEIEIIGTTRLPYEPKGLGEDGHLIDFAELLCGTGKLKLPGE